MKKKPESSVQGKGSLQTDHRVTFQSFGEISQDVIASAAKQSRRRRIWGLLRRFTPRNDVRDEKIRPAKLKAHTMYQFPVERAGTCEVNGR